MKQTNSGQASKRRDSVQSSSTKGTSAQASAGGCTHADLSRKVSGPATGSQPTRHIGGAAPPYVIEPPQRQPSLPCRSCGSYDYHEQCCQELRAETTPAVVLPPLTEDGKTQEWRVYTRQWGLRSFIYQQAPTLAMSYRVHSGPLIPSHQNQVWTTGSVFSRVESMNN